jgi:transposase
MKALSPKQMLEKQNKELRIRLENRNGKAELALSAMEDEVKALKDQLRARDTAKDELINALKAQLRDKGQIISMLQAGYTPLTAENETLRQKIESLQGEISTPRDALDKAEDRVARLAALLKKNSSTSDKPPSSEFARAKRTSDKEKSGKKVGGQPGHKGHRLEPSPNPDEVVDIMPSSVCPDCGGTVISDGSYESRQLFDVEISIRVTEERVHDGCCGDCGKELNGEFSEGFNSHAGYGPTVRSIVAVLNTDCNVPVHQTAVFVSCLTEGQLNMSDGTIVNIVSDLAKRLDETVKEIKDALAACGVLNVDETGVRINGNLNWMQIISNEKFSLFGRNPSRGTLNEEMNDLLLLFTGILVHDHLSSYYGYKHLSHAECNVHILRYLKAVMEIMKHPWAKEMADLLKEANKRKKELLEQKAEEMESEELESFRSRYNDILARGRKEYEAAIEGKKNITYYTEERRLLARLEKYINEHLHFLTNFAVPFSNNTAEHGARHIKGKKKTSGGFRSDGGADNYATIASVVATLRKHGMNVFPAIYNAFRGVAPKFSNSEVPDTS